MTDDERRARAMRASGLLQDAVLRQALQELEAESMAASITAGELATREDHRNDVRALRRLVGRIHAWAEDMAVRPAAGEPRQAPAAQLRRGV